MSKLYNLTVLIVFLSLPLASPTLVFSFQLPDTGQHTCYDANGAVIDCPSPGEPFYGQDAQYQGAEPAYQDNEDGTVTDLNTGLVWQQSTADTNDDGSVDSNDRLIWQEACEYCDGLDLADSQNWRLPIKRELVSLINYGLFYPALNPVFYCLPNYHWSCSESSSLVGYSWAVGLLAGSVDIEDQDERRNVLCVKGETPGPTFIDHNNGTVEDTLTDLVWQKGDSHNDSGARSWEMALEYCERLDFAGCNDWRLPNVRELESLVKLTSVAPTIEEIFDCRADWYWTSSSYVYNGKQVTQAWWVSFSRSATIDNSFKSSDNYVRCVRGGLEQDEPNKAMPWLHLLLSE